MIRLARGAISTALGLETAAAPGDDAPWLSRRGATFVTLTKRGKLCGCIGSIEAHRSVRDDVEENAVAAAFQDPRFRPLRAAEFDDVRVEVSLLSPAEPMPVTSEAEAIAALRPKEDGVIFEYGRHRSVYLPQVWEQIPEPSAFLAHLKEKAGVTGDFWAPGVRLSRFTARKWKESSR